MYRRCLLGLIVLLIASGLWSGALAASADMGAGALVRLELSDAPAEYTFTPSANGLYAVYLFPAGDEMTARAELWDGDEMLVRGDGRLKLISSRLTADRTYTLKVTGSGAALMEVARETLSRSFGMPLELDDGGGYTKLIARPGDVHWYAVTAEASGPALIACAPEMPGLRLQASLFDASGRRVASAETLASGAAVLSAEFKAGETCFIRASGLGGRKGKYSLSMQRSESADRAQSVILSADELQIEGRSTRMLSAAVYPENACGLIFLDSTDPGVAQAWSSGFVEGRREGDAVITAYSYGGARSSCRVTVNAVPVQGVAFSVEHITVEEGESRSLMAVLEPANTTERRLVYASSDEEILIVDKNGVVAGVREGTAAVTVTAEGGLSDEISVTVKRAPARYRALLIGEQNYAPTVETVREGSVKSVESVAAMLTANSLEGGGFSVRTLMDASRDEVLAGVREAFGGAREADVSLLYITCHGFYQAGMTFFVMADGSVLSAADLERELRAIPGEIVLLVDCCGSGGVLGEAGGPEDMLDGVVSVFQGAVGGASVRGSKFRVIASAYLDQDSYRIGFGDGGMSTVFARALCDAAGWSMDRGAPSALNADVNYDGLITLDELDSYLTKRVAWYLALAGDYAQTVSVYPKNDPAVIFARISE